MKRFATFTLILLAVTIISSCSSIEKTLKSNDFEAKFTAAMNYYNDNSYSKAIQLFENLSLYYRGKEHAEDISWYYGQSLLKEYEYYTASHQFKNFHRQFPYSARAEEALYLSAYCKYMEAPPYSLDQKKTKEAIAEFEQYVDRYPNSTHIPEINTYLDEMRNKLMRKDYEIAVGYYTIEDYHAAYVSLQSFLNLYSDSPYREDATYYLLRSGYEYAINSREDKMKERLQTVVNDFDKFATSFSDSKYMAAAQSIYTKTKAALAKLEQNNEEKK